ncbi:MAG: hypothetical protein IPO08_24145 [Xanthomonadales bacterium]|nr:hypothetical protein [Xanthomonadales bacterium]
MAGGTTPSDFRGGVPALEGCAVSVTVTDGVNSRRLTQSGSPYQDAHGEPIKAEAKIFTATLTKNGELIALASTQTEVRKAWEMGENNAKSRLYESLGLPAAFQQHDIVQDETHLRGRCGGSGDGAKQGLGGCSSTRGASCARLSQSGQTGTAGAKRGRRDAAE